MPNEKITCRYCHMTFRILISNKPRGERLICSECGRKFCAGNNSLTGKVQVYIEPRNHKQWKGVEKYESGCFRG